MTTVTTVTTVTTDCHDSYISTAINTCYRARSISQLPKLCVKITIFMQGYVLIADWSVAHFAVIMNDVMNDNMAAFGQQTNQLSGRGLA